MDGKIELSRITYQLLQPLAHFFAAPGGGGTIVYRSALIGNYQVWIDSDNPPIFLAPLACAIGVMQTEKIRTWLFKGDAVHLKPVREGVYLAVLFHKTIALALKKCGLYGVRNPVSSVFPGIYGNAVDHNLKVVLQRCAVVKAFVVEQRLNLVHLPLINYPYEPLLQ